MHGSTHTYHVGGIKRKRLGHTFWLSSSPRWKDRKRRYLFEHMEHEAFSRPQEERVLPYFTWGGSNSFGISAKCLLITAPAIAGTLNHLFNLSLARGEIPQGWKAARVTPIFKAGNKMNIENYRPISVLPVVVKVFERLVYRENTRTMMKLWVYYSKLVTRWT